MPNEETRYLHGKKERIVASHALEFGQMETTYSVVSTNILAPVVFDTMIRFLSQSSSAWPPSSDGPSTTTTHKIRLMAMQCPAWRVQTDTLQPDVLRSRSRPSVPNTCNRCPRPCAVNWTRRRRCAHYLQTEPQWRYCCVLLIRLLVKATAYATLLCASSYFLLIYYTSYYRTPIDIPHRASLMFRQKSKSYATLFFTSSE